MSVNMTLLRWWTPCAISFRNRFNPDMRVSQEIPDFRKFPQWNSANSLIFVQFWGNFQKFQEFFAISGIFATVHSHVCVISKSVWEILAIARTYVQERPRNISDQSDQLFRQRKSPRNYLDNSPLCPSNYSDANLYPLFVRAISWKCIISLIMWKTHEGIPGLHEANCGEKAVLFGDTKRLVLMRISYWWWTFLYVF